MTSRVSFAAEWKDDEGGGGPTSVGVGSGASIGNDHRGGRRRSATAGTAATSSSPSLACPNCGSTNIESDEASGASICTECGVVVEENAIVSSVEFVEGAGGTSSMVGQFVRDGSTKAYTGGGGGQGGRYGFGRDSRENTLNNGRRRIQEVASRLRLGAHFVDAAHRLFTLAVEKNFVQGRRTTHVVAACLYIACRQEKSQHMLIDFSDALQVNVYTLGTCFLKFRRLLGIKLEIIDPALYIYRFAAHLDLDDQANAVGMTALRIVGRMKRDWIVAGRRPAGVCAAALLIAARAHGFTRENQDVTKILRVCGMTVTRRVKEFEHTPSAGLSLEQFNTVDIESECDPPVFTRNRLREARALAIQEKNLALLNSGALDDPREGKRASRWREARKPGKGDEKREEFDRLYSTLEEEMREECKEAAMCKRVGALQDVSEGTSSVVADEADGGEESFVATSASWDGAKRSTPNGKGGHERQIQLRDPDGRDILPSHIQYPLGSNKRAIILPQEATTEELQKSTQPAEDQLNLTDWKLEMPEFAADEIGDLFRDEEEVKAKEVIFNRMNKEYLDREEKKEEERLNAEAAEKDKEEDEAAQAERRARYLRNSRGRKRKHKVEDELGDPTTEEALLAEISRRKISRKINYDAMSAIFDGSGGFATDLLEDAPGPGPEDLAHQDFMI